MADQARAGERMIRVEDCERMMARALAEQKARYEDQIARLRSVVSGVAASDESSTSGPVSTRQGNGSGKPARPADTST